MAPSRWRWQTKREFLQKKNQLLSARPRFVRPAVELLEDRVALSTFLVTNTNDSGPGSLRQATVDANANPGADLIQFNIPGSGVQTIPTASALGISDTVTIDGRSEGVFQGTPGYSGPPLIQLRGPGATMGQNGLIITASNCTVNGLIINGFGYGIQIYASGDGTTITGSYIGTSSDGTSSVPNGEGIWIDGASNNVIGGTSLGDGNVISGNYQRGILIFNTCMNNLVQGNFIGTDPSGTKAVSNNEGVEISFGASDNTVGGVTAGARNLISGNGVIGVSIQYGSQGNVVEGNYIGTNAAGTVALSDFIGLDILESANNTVGGPASGAGNLISGNNNGAGIAISGSGATRNVIQGNLIGADASGNVALPNGTGVEIQQGASNNLIGGTIAGARNIITRNAYQGVSIFTGSGSPPQGNAVLSNSIFSNGHLGIDLGNDGVTLNTPGGPHTGPNNLQNYPVLRPYVAAGTVVGTLNSTPNTTFRVEFFANPTWDPSGHGQGKDLLGSLMVTTDAQGNASFTFSFAPISGEPILTATATDPAGNTSEFSEGVDFAPDDITGRVAQSGQWWIGKSNGSAFNNTIVTTWDPNITWVDVVTGDFNGDGLTDIAARDANSGNWWVGISTGSSFTTTLWTTWAPNVTWADVKVGDFTGDGKTDIAGRDLQTGNWWVAQSTGSSFTNRLWTTWDPHETWVDVKVGDFNGDGKADITGRDLATGAWWTGLSTGSSFTTTLWAVWSTGFTWVDVQVGDFNGDGKADITARAKESGQ